MNFKFQLLEIILSEETKIVTETFFGWYRQCIYLFKDVFIIVGPLHMNLLTNSTIATRECYY